jgi:hypothetical protein
MSGGTIGNYGVSDISSVGVVPVVQAKNGVTQTFQLVIAGDIGRILLTGIAPTIIVTDI